MAARLRLVLCTPDVAADGPLVDRAREACRRADVELVEVEDLDAASAAVRERLAEAEQVIAVGAALQGAPAGTVWVTPLDLDVRGDSVRVAEEGDALLYEAVVTELAERR